MFYDLPHSRELGAMSPSYAASCEVKIRLTDLENLQKQKQRYKLFGFSILKSSKKGKHLCGFSPIKMFVDYLLIIKQAGKRDSYLYIFL